MTAVAANTVFGFVWHHWHADYAFALSAIMIAGTLAVLPRLMPDEAPHGSARAALSAAAA